MRRPSPLAVGLLVGLMTVSAVTVQGCGTIFFRFLPQKVAITSAPGGASVSVDGRPPEEVTPVTIRFPPTRDHTIKLRYVDKETGEIYVGDVLLDRSIRVMPIVVNLIFNLGLGLILDALTGALFHFPNRKPHVVLVPEGSEGTGVEGTKAGLKTTKFTKEPKPKKPKPKPHPARPDPEVEPVRPRPTPEPEVVVPPDAEPCEICAEPRGDITPCPSCKME